MKGTRYILDLDVLKDIKMKFDSMGYANKTLDEIINVDPFLGKFVHTVEYYEWGIYLLLKNDGMPTDPFATVALFNHANALASMTA